MLMMNSKEYTNQYQRARRTRLAKQGMCAMCCARPAEAGFRTCEVCRNKSRQGNHIIRGRNKPPQPIICPICESIPSRFFWHHWDDSRPKLGIWVCPYCNIIVELEDRGLVDRYRELKVKTCDAVK